MDYNFYHDAQSKIVSRSPVEPQVQEDRDRSGRSVVIWRVNMEIEVTRADNVNVRGQWKYPLREYPSQTFENIDNRYNREIVISYFLSRHTPAGDQIDEETYLFLKSEYENQARRAQ